VWNGFYGSFEEFFRLQRTLILYPRNIPEFVMSEDILSLKEVSSYLGAATDFYPNKSCKLLNIMVPGAETAGYQTFPQQNLIFRPKKPFRYLQ